MRMRGGRITVVAGMEDFFRKLCGKHTQVYVGWQTHSNVRGRQTHSRVRGLVDTFQCNRKGRVIISAGLNTVL